MMDTESLWKKTADIRERPALDRDLFCDVCVIGGGMVGILTAFFAAKRGYDTVVLEADRIGSGQTKNTTAKITSQHGLKYAHIAHEFGPEAARQYASMNQQAIDTYESLIEEYEIDCHFSRVNSYLYTLGEVSRLREEYEAAKAAGIGAYLTEETDLPFPVASAMVFPRQAQFHPLEFLKAISEKVEVFEHTRVLKVEKEQVTTDKGTVNAKHVVFACHYPFINVPGYYFARQHQSRSYIVALENASALSGIYFSADKNGLSFRNYGSLLLLGGAGHRTGENRRGGSYDELEQTAARLFPKSRVVCRWSAQDCMPVDCVPYIGRYAASEPNWYVATGFGKWGMTSSMVAAKIISGLICGNCDKDAEVFAPDRFPLSSVDDVLSQTGKAIKGLTKELLTIPDEHVASIKPGHGGIVIYENVKAGVYRDEDGTVYAIDTRCPHMGCQLEWNPDEKSWDCPCHGSRFSYRGELIDGPAQENASGAH